MAASKSKPNEVTQWDKYVNPPRKILQGIGVDVRLISGDWLPDFDRFYVPNSVRNRTHMKTGWQGRLQDGRTMDYFCPTGWRRFSLNIGSVDNISYWDSTTIMYHGTAPENISNIILNGFRANKCQHGKPAVYLSPSICYCAHPRYAKVVKMGGRYYQVVLEVRVKTSKVTSFKGETMNVKEKFPIDKNFPDNEGMEFLFTAEQQGLMVTMPMGLFVTGVMVRCLKIDPMKLKESEWWTCWRTADYLYENYYSQK